MRRIWIPVTLMLCAASAGCVQGYCADTAAARSTATVLVDDAQSALAQAQLVIPRIDSPDRRDQALDALQAAHAALRAAEAQLYEVQGVCSSPDVSTIFGEFVRAWRFLAPFLALLGGDGESRVAAPIVVGR